MELLWIPSYVVGILCIVSGNKISSVSPGSSRSCPANLPNGQPQSHDPAIPIHTYFPIGDKKSFGQMFEILGGETSGLNFEEFLKTGCLRRFMINSNHEGLSDFIIAPGYSQAAMQCNYTDPINFEVSCTVPNKDPKYDFRLSGVLADVNAYFLSVRCYSSGLYTWEVFATSPVLKPGDLEKVKEKVIALGFDWDKTAVRIPYEQCES